jgi:PPOX class probable F420-dependent enzyme
MTAPLSEFVLKLIEGKNFAHVATLMPDGSPQNSAVWIEMQGDSISFNTAEGRVKPDNMRRDPRVAISITDAENPYLAAFIRGRVTAITPEGGDAGIDRLAKKYLDADSYPFRQPGEVRLVVTIEPEHVSTMGEA